MAIDYSKGYIPRYATESLLNSGYQGRSPDDEYFYGGNSNTFRPSLKFMRNQNFEGAKNRNITALNQTPAEKQAIINQSYLRNNLPIPNKYSVKKPNPFLVNNKGFSSLGQQQNSQDLIPKSNFQSNNIRNENANNTPLNYKNNLMNMILSPGGRGAARGLLKAGAYSSTPINNAQALSMMLEGAESATDKARKLKLEQSTFDLNKKLTDSQIFKNYNPVIQKSNIAKMMSESFPLLKPGTPEYQEEFNKMLNKSQQIINMNANAMNEGAKTMATEHAKEVIATNKIVQDNYELTSRLNTMENLVDDPDFESGPMTEATLPLRRLLSEAGFFNQ